MSALTDMGFHSYQQYLRSDVWAATRAKYFETHAKRCAGCGRSNVQIDLHHRTYRRVGKERMADLVAVCRGCHHAIHKRNKSQDETLHRSTRKVLRKKARAVKKIQRIESKKTRWEAAEKRRAREMMEHI